jgi:RimJ/RimL family protein N-acetyltransferase
MTPIPPTPRLLFRPLELADAAGMFALDSDPAVHRYLGGIGGVPVSSLAQSEAVVEFIQAQYRTHGIGRWAVLHRATGAFMGWAGLKLVTDEVNGHRNFYDLGYRFRPEYWDQGYGYEAAQAWLDYGFGVMELPAICAFVDVENVASCRILEKVGLRRGKAFVAEGTRCWWFEGQRTDWRGRQAE